MTVNPHPDPAPAAGGRWGQQRPPAALCAHAGAAPLYARGSRAEHSQWGGLVGESGKASQ
jgi:hypothetical protein